jgi:hypothetical protein
MVDKDAALSRPDRFRMRVSIPIVGGNSAFRVTFSQVRVSEKGGTGHLYPPLSRPKKGVRATLYAQKLAEIP